MATYAVSTSQNYTAVNGGTFNDYDRIVISQGAELIIDTDTNIIERLQCTTLGRVINRNTSTTTPIFIKHGENGTVNAQIRFEAGSVYEVDGDFISIGTSDGTASQTFTLPTTGSMSIPELNHVFVYVGGSTTPSIYSKVDSLTDCFGVEKLGNVFTHDVGANTVTFGDGTEGFIPPNSAELKVANIYFINDSTGTTYTDFDAATSGTIMINGGSYGSDFAFNFSQGSLVNVRNGSFAAGRENVNLGNLKDGLVLKDSGFLLTNTGTPNSVSISLSGTSNFEVDNVSIYNTLTSSAHNGLTIAAASNGTVKNCVVVAPNNPSSTNRYSLYTTSANVTFENCYVASSAVGYYAGAGGNGSKFINCHFNAAGRRNSPTNGSVAVYGVNSADILMDGFFHYPLLKADGAHSSNTYHFSLSTGTANWTINNADIYCGETGDSSQTNNPFFVNGSDHRFNDIRIHGQYSVDTINYSPLAANPRFSNIVMLDPDAQNNDCEWTDGAFYDLVATPDRVDSAPAAEGTNVASLHFYRGNNKSIGYLFKMMGKEGANNAVDTSGVTGQYFFDNAGKFYMDTSGDVAVFETGWHGGITGHSGVVKTGSTVTNFDVKVAMRQKGGSWTAYYDDSNAGLDAAQASIAGYDSDIETQYRLQVTRTASNLTNYIYNIRIDTEIDPNYVAPFILNASTLTLTGLKNNTEVRIYDSVTLTELGGQENVTTGSFEYEFDTANVGDVNIAIHALGFQNIYLRDFDLSGGSTNLPIQQQIDRQYSNV